MEKVFFTRLELYELVWKFPMTQITKHYGVSSMKIKNACEKIQIPFPGLNQQIKFKNNRIGKPKLPLAYNGIQQIVILKKAYEIQFRKIVKSTPLLDLIKDIESDLQAPLKVPEQLINPVRSRQNTVSYWDNKDEKKDTNAILHLNVAPQNIPRALRLMNALIKLLKYRGHRFEQNPYKTGIIFMKNEIEIDLNLREALKRIPLQVDQDTSECVQTGVFILQIRKDSYKKEWRDCKISLENNLARIIATLELIAVEEKRWKEAGNSI
jgi:hypothetical protein